MEFGLLGPIDVRDGERTIELPSRQVRRLLAALLLAPNRVVSTDRLYEVLWGVEPPESAANTLQTYVLHLRNALEPDRGKRDPGRYVQRRDPGYLIAIEPEQIDAVRFRDRVERGQRAIEREPERAAGLLREALAMWRGEPLADLTFDLFAQPVIVELSELRIRAVESRIDADLACGRHDGVIAELRELVREQPLRERLWEQLMLALYRSGRQADALATFSEVRHIVVDQLGVEPGPALGRMHRAILGQDPALEWSAPAAAAAIADVRPPEPRHEAEGVALSSADATELLGRGMTALGRRDWAAAYASLSAAAESIELDAEALDALAESAMWLGEYESSIAARQRAHAVFVRLGDARRGAMTAIALALHCAARLRLAVAAGWYGRAERLLTDVPEGPEHGYLAWAASLMAIGARHEGPALDAARRTQKIGEHVGDPTLLALGLTFQGYLLVRRGDLREGLRMLDEGMAAAVSGTVAPFPTSLIFCRMIDTCQLLGDYRRADEWLEAIAQSPMTACITSYPGDCDTHRTQVLVGRGAWQEAERLARRACAGMERFDVSHAGLAFYELGQVRLRSGDLEAAAAAFERAAELGTVPQPGAALLDRSRGQIHRAAAALAAALADEPWDALARVRLLPTEVEVAIEIGDVARARAAATELAQLAEAYPSNALHAAAATAAGCVTLAEGDAASAVTAFRTGVHGWRDAGAPYETARTRVMLARALAADGHVAIAANELAQARGAFTQLGAALDVEAADALLRAYGAPAATQA